jgi:hypothetical protein
MDWNGKVLKTYESASQVTSGLAVSKTSLYVIANNETDYPPPYTGMHNLDVATGKTRWVEPIPLGGGGTHGAQWHDGKLWIIASRLNAMIRGDPESWTCDYALRRNDPPDTVRSHDMTFDDQGLSGWPRPAVQRIMPMACRACPNTIPRPARCWNR